MKNSKVLGYGMGSLGKDFALGVISSYLLVFYTDVLGITAAAAGFILVVTKIWDAINDPIMGYIVDRTNSKWGRFRPYILFVPIPLAVFSMLCFIAPDFSTTGKFIYALVTYTITGMLFTAYDVPLWGMLPSITENDNDKNKCISIGRFFTSLAMLLATSFALPLIHKLGGGSEVANLKVGYPKFMMIIGIISIVFAWITFISTKEKLIIENKRKSENVFKEFIGVLNKPLLMVFVAMTLQGVVLVLPNVVGAYYVIYYIGRPDLISVYFLTCGGFGLLAPPIATIALKKISAKKLTIIAMLGGIIVSLIAYFIPNDNITLLLAMFAIFGLCSTMPMVTITSMLMETGEYIAKVKKRRADGVIFSLNSFAIKCGTAIASGISSIVLTVTHYNPGAFEQAANVAIGLNATRTLIVAILYLIVILVVSQFKIPQIEDGGKEVVI